MKIKHLFIGILLLSAIQISAQQLPNFTIYRDQWNVINPAALSNNYIINELNFTVGGAYRRNWLNVNDAPQTQILNFEMVLEDRNAVLALTSSMTALGNWAKLGFTAITPTSLIWADGPTGRWLLAWELVWYNTVRN